MQRHAVCADHLPHSSVALHARLSLMGFLRALRGILILHAHTFYGRVAIEVLPLLAPPQLVLDTLVAVSSKPTVSEFATRKWSRKVTAKVELK